VVLAWDCLFNYQKVMLLLASSATCLTAAACLAQGRSFSKAVVGRLNLHSAASFAQSLCGSVSYLQRDEHKFPNQQCAIADVCFEQLLCPSL
jgi:hypothetical protein